MRKTPKDKQIEKKQNKKYFALYGFNNGENYKAVIDFRIGNLWFIINRKVNI